MGFLGPLLRLLERLVSFFLQLRKEKQQQAGDPVDELIEHLEAGPQGDKEKFKQFYRRIRLRVMARRLRKSDSQTNRDDGGRPA